MKFSHKLSLFVIALTGVLFALGGAFLVYTVFQNHLSDTVAGSTSQHILERYSLEADMLATQTAGLPVDAGYLRRYGERKTGYLGEAGRWMALYLGGEEVYTNLPPWLPGVFVQEAREAGGEQYILRKTGEAVLLLLASNSGRGEEEITLLSCYDISPVYAQRQQNLLFLLGLCAVILLLAAGSVFVFSAFLTRPIGHLNEASQKIAAGNYRQRVEIHTRDEVGQLAQSFNAMAATLEEKIDAMELSLRQKDDFVAAFTHEVKTPMTTLVGYAKLLRLREQPPEVRQQAAAAIFHEAKRLESLSRHLLELMGLGEKEPELECVKLAWVVAFFQRSLSAENLAGAELLYTEEEPFYIVAQKDLLADLLRNLVLNALAAGPRDGRVLLHARRQGGACRVTVTDKGRGIPAAELARICEPFYMVDKARRRREGASGLGLSIAERIARLHGGGLEFKSVEGEGTEVSFSVGLCPHAKEAAE